MMLDVRGAHLNFSVRPGRKQKKSTRIQPDTIAQVYECVAHAVGFGGRLLWWEKVPLFSFFFFSGRWDAMLPGSHHHSWWKRQK